jgi:nitrate reductase NapAB chaperone NapD
VIITGSAILIEPGSDEEVLRALKAFPEVTFQVKSESGNELVVNFEADDPEALEDVCERMKERIPKIIDITHLYVDFEEEVEKTLSGETD